MKQKLLKKNHAISKIGLIVCLLWTSSTLTLFANFNSDFLLQNTTNVPLTKAVDAIAAAYRVSIVYEVEQLETVTVNNWKISRQSAEDDLKFLLKNHNFTYKKINATTFVIKKIKGQKLGPNLKNQPSPQKISQPTIEKLTAKGFVYDADSNEPLIGVNIIVKSGKEGAATDLDGSFSIVVEEGDILVFSYLGYSMKELKVKSSDLGIVYLETDAKQLDEVVVVGYGTQKRSDLTGALSSIGEKELKSLPSTGLDQALQGRAAGVFVTQNSGAPGGAVSIRIRGIGSTLTAEPLYVIDGIPVVNDNQGTSTNFSELDGGGQNSNALNTINPSDIESIEVLKDASATAIYGARAANGVVLITTKRGKEGKSNIAFDTYYGLQKLSRKIPVLSLQLRFRTQKSKKIIKCNISNIPCQINLR